jgi:tetratricopeptide (TPR) repeat protein
MKLSRAAAAITALSILLTGCGSLAGRPNIESGFSYIESHEYRNALESFDAAEENGEDTCLLSRGRGIAHYHLAEYEEAVSALLLSLASDDGIVDEMDFDTNYYLADSYLELEEYNKAKEVYDAIIAMRSKDSNAYYLRGIAELASGNHDGGYQDFTKAISLNSRDYSMIIRIYRVLDEYGYSDEAMAILQTAMNNGIDFMSNYEKGQISYYLGNNAEAQSYLEAARNERDQDKEPVVIMLGHTVEKQGDYNYAISIYRNYLSEVPDSAHIYNQLGMCQIRQGDYKAAVQSFEQGLGLDDKSMNQALMMNQITAYEYMGEFDVASSLMNTYLSTYPDDEKAKREDIFLSTR